MEEAQVIYEVNIAVDPNVEEAFLIWLRQHMEEMEEVDGFLPGSVLFREVGEGLHLCVQYQVESIEKLDHYLNHQAEDMRGRLPEMFKDHLKFSRRILQSVEVV